MACGNEGNRHMAWVRLAYAIVWRNGRRVCIIKWSLTFRAFLSQDILLITNPFKKAALHVKYTHLYERFGSESSRASSSWFGGTYME
jgi:hypothetical protein